MEERTIEITDADTFAKAHQEILDLLFYKYDFTIPTAVGILESVKFDILSGDGDDENEEE